jgi:hypothetical protein
MRKLALTAPALLLLAACTAASPPPARPAVPPPSVETAAGQVLGAQAEAEIGESAPVVFPALTFSGPVAAVSRDAALGVLDGTRTFATPRGSLTVRYAAGARAAASPSDVGSGTRACVFSRLAASGTYAVTGGTGAFAGATGHGVYSLVFIIETKKADGGACSPSGVPIPSGDQVDFTAGGPYS